jgi:alkylated DNA repair dioxygenase AlkB
LDFLRNLVDTTAREILLKRCSEWLKGVDEIKKPISESMEGKLLTSCLVNYYDGNDDFIPYHFDEIRAHGNIKLIATLSLGSIRPF